MKRTVLIVSVVLVLRMAAVGVDEVDEPLDAPTGNALLRMCTSYDPQNPATHDSAGIHFAHTAACAAYIIGVVDALILDGKVCYNTPVTDRQKKDIAVKYLQDHPEMLRFESVVLVRDAVTKVWPCKH